MKRLVKYISSLITTTEPILFIVFGLIIVIFVAAGIVCNAWPLVVGALLLPVAYIVLVIAFRFLLVAPLDFLFHALIPRPRGHTCTEVTFRSNKFPPYDGEEEQINPGLWGKRLAEYFVEKLKGTEIETEEIIPEDWGWYIPIKNDGFRLAICCGHQQGDDDEFLCFILPDKPVIRKFFKKIDTTEQVGRVLTAMDRILSSDLGIKSVEWTDIGKKGK